MARATEIKHKWICDRCHNRFSTVYEELPETWRAIVVTNTCGDTCEGYDLCEDCYKVFLTWTEDGREQKIEVK